MFQNRYFVLKIAQNIQGPVLLKVVSAIHQSNDARDTELVRGKN